MTVGLTNTQRELFKASNLANTENDIKDGQLTLITPSKNKSTAVLACASNYREYVREPFLLALRRTTAYRVYFTLLSANGVTHDIEASPEDRIMISGSCQFTPMLADDFVING